MQFLGLGSFLHDENSYQYTYEYTHVGMDINNILISDGCYSNIELKDNDDTKVLEVIFNNTANPVSNVIDLSTVTDLIIKKRKKGSSLPWQTIYTKPVSLLSDNLEFSYNDYLCKNKQWYEYKMIPVINGVEQNDYNIISVFSDFRGIYFTTGYEQKGSQFDISSSYDRVTSNSVVQTINSKYPTVIKNGIVNYSKGNITVRFLKLTDDEEYGDLDNNYKYRSDIIDFLIEHNVIVFKNYDGFMAIISIEDGNISEDFSEMAESLIPKQSFNWVQIGDADNYDELSKYGLSGIET